VYALSRARWRWRAKDGRPSATTHRS